VEGGLRGGCGALPYAAIGQDLGLGCRGGSSEVEEGRYQDESEEGQSSGPADQGVWSLSMGDGHEAILGRGPAGVE